MAAIYELGPFRLDAEAGVLSRAGVPMPLGPRAVAVLAALVTRANEYLPKAGLMDAAWPGLVVEEGNLAVQISGIRRVLGQVAGGERWVETLARRGYRFVGPVERLPDASQQSDDAQRARTNLPESRTSFVGRERELVEIKRLLPTTRLLTVVGTGGIGKTRLAQQLAAEVMDAYREGVWFVDLAPLADPMRVPASVAHVLGAREMAGKSLLETLCSLAKDQQLLLVLDNCEHLLAGCAQLADAMLRGTSAPTIIATSREALRVAGEQIYPLSPLSLPDPQASVETMAGSEAVQLFVDRAQRTQPGFELTEGRAPAIAQLCVHLDGIPLALELAAARLRALSVEQINARLNQRFKLLTEGSSTALPRQQTLRGTLDWSYGLLAEQERTVLRRLTIFSGGFSLEAAQSVASDDSIDEFAVTDMLSHLVASSLVGADTSGVRARYRLLETTRAYALEKLCDAEEEALIRRRHAQYFRALFEAAPDDWLLMSDAEWRGLYLPEIDNVRAALDWALGAGDDSATAVALAGGSGPIWSTLSLWAEGAQRLASVAARGESHGPAVDQARLWHWLGVLSDAAPDQALTRYERALDLYRRTGDALGVALTLVRIARVLAQQGRLGASESLLTEAFPALLDANRPKALGMYFTNLGYLKLLGGEPAVAKGHYETSLSYYRESGSEYAVLAHLGELGDVNWALGDLDAAVSMLLEYVGMMRRSPMSRKSSLGYALGNLAGLFTERGELEEALAAARDGLPLLRDAGYLWIFADHVALRSALAGKLANAARIAGYSDAEHAKKGATYEPNEARARARLWVLLREKLDAAQLERFVAEGAKLSEDRVCRLALE
jgi:predicted ATPase/DNA-binding winged helix-turn-helix (wHTH) protein